MNAVEIIKTATSGLIGVVGTLTNLVSLTYFLRHDSRSMGSKLLILLNTFDLFVCISATGVNVFHNVANASSGTPQLAFDKTTDIFRLLFRISTQCTGFTTCLLSITRTISFIKPFYRVDQVGIAAASAVHAALIALMETIVIFLFWTESGKCDIAMNAMNIVELIVLTLIFVLVVCSNTFSVARLKIVVRSQENMAGINKRATITVFILSVLFCTFNVTFIATYFCYVFMIRIPGTVFWIAMWLALPLNSACNPLVYIWRKEHMRQYLRREWHRVTNRRSETHTALTRVLSVV